MLRPEICAVLARVEPLGGARLVLDPITGRGVIGEAWLRAGAGSVWLNAIAGAQRSSAGVRWTHDDVRRLPVAPGTVDAIVTDPPWGHFSSVSGRIENLYGVVGATAAEWLRPGGAIVVLTGASEAAVQALITARELVLERDHPVLVNGRKARVIRVRRTA